MVNAPGTYCGGCLRAEDYVLRKLGISLVVPSCLVVEARDVEPGAETVVHHGVELVHSAGHDPAGVLPVADVLQHRGYLVSVRSPLCRNFIADAPHYHGRGVAEMADHIDYVLLRPVIEVPVVAVLAFCHLPFVEGLRHYHEAHLVAEFHQLLRRHVVRGPDGVTAHILQHFQLVMDGCPVYGGTERTEVVVEADAPYDAPLSVEEESAVGYPLHGPDSEAVVHNVEDFPVTDDGRLGLVENRVLR